MGCDCATAEIRVGASPLAVTTTSATFFPLTGPQSSVDIARVVARFRKENSLGMWSAEFGYQVSSDLVTWTNNSGGGAGTWETFGGAWSYDTPADGAYGTVTSTVAIDELFVRFGIQFRSTASGLVAATFYPTFSFQNF